MQNLLGLYEKALPADLAWLPKLAMVKGLGFDFMEISIDESDTRLSRLYWSKEEKLELRKAMDETGVALNSMCFSGHRRFPLGSRNPETREKALELMHKAIEFANYFGIRVIQLAGYDVYYEEHGEDTTAYFIEGLKKAAALGEKYQVMLAIEIMDTPFINSIQKYLEYYEKVGSPWLKVYPDIGNISAWQNDVEHELAIGFPHIVGVHIKETLNVTSDFPGKFRDMTFGQGHVDFIKAFKKLYSLGYNGPFLIEMWGDKVNNPLIEIAKAKEFVLEKLKESGF